MRKSTLSSKSPSSTYIDSQDELRRLNELFEEIGSRDKGCVSWERNSSTSGYTVKNRGILIDWMAEFCKEHRLHRETFHLAVNILDRYIGSESGMRVNRGDLQQVGLSALLISIKNSVSDVTD